MHQWIKSFNLIRDIIFSSNMTMNCPLCGALMVWLNGSITNDPSINYYQCRNDNIYVTHYRDGNLRDSISKEKIIKNSKSSTNNTEHRYSVCHAVTCF